MDKKNWHAIQNNGFAFPAEQSAPALKEELFANLASTDPELRDTIGLEAFYHWLQQGLYSPEEVRSLIPRLIANFQTGLGKGEDDSVFLRSFSALWLALILEYDSKGGILKPGDVASILEAALAYFPAERDRRGIVAGKGWAHSIAHTADLLNALAHNRYTDARNHIKILDCIASKLWDSTDWVYMYGEDGRLARVAIMIFVRETLSLDQVKGWLDSMSAGWPGAWLEQGSTHAFFNQRNFLHAIHWRIPLLKVDKVPNKKALLKLIQDTLEQARPWE